MYKFKEWLLLGYTISVHNDICGGGGRGEKCAMNI